jgi:hypothetical protein
MRTMQLLDDVEFHTERPYAQPILVDCDAPADGRHGNLLRDCGRPFRSREELFGGLAPSPRTLRLTPGAMHPQTGAVRLPLLLLISETIRLKERQRHVTCA